MDIRIDFAQDSAGGNSTYIRGIPVSESGTPEIRLASPLTEEGIYIIRKGEGGIQGLKIIVSSFDIIQSLDYENLGTFYGITKDRPGNEI